LAITASLFTGQLMAATPVVDEKQAGALMLSFFTNSTKYQIN